MRITFTTLVMLCCLCFGMQAQNLWTGNVDSDWDNPGNWVGGVPTTGVTATVPGNPVGGNNPIYNGGPIIDYTIQVSGILSINSLVYNNGTIINFSSGQIIINGNFINSGGKTFDNDGMLENNGTFDNYGTFDNAASATFMNMASATFNNYATYKSNGAITNNGITNNYGSLRSTNSFINNNTLTILAGSFEAPFGSVYDNPAGSVLTIESGATFDINTPFTNAGAITNRGELLLSTAVVLTNDATITNDGMLETAGLLQNNNTLTNNNILRINDAGTVENTGTLSNNNGTIDISICGILIQNAGNTIGGMVISDGLIYEISGSVTVTGGELGQVFSNLTDRKPPVAGCKPGVFKELDASGNVSLIITDVDKGSYGECGAAIVSRTLSPQSFTTADIGDQVVTLRIEDAFGFVSTCDAVVSILPYQPPIVPTDDPEIDFNCPADITVTGLLGSQSAPASWTEPEATTTCTAGSGNGPDCSSLPNSIANFVYLGEYNDSRYFLSNNSNVWPDARTAAENAGGHLVVINDAAENAFVQSQLSSGSIWIGLTDENSEGNFGWVNSDPLSYTNWSANEPSGASGEDFVRLIASSGQWTDRTINQSYPYVVEIPCPSQTSCSQVSENISGFTYVGEFEGSKFYRSNNTRSWQDAKSDSEAAGGRLAVVDNAAKNSFLASNNNSFSIWIGLSDVNQEGTYVWENGQVATYFNWNSNEPNNLNNEDYVEMLASGRWNDLRSTTSRRFFMEIPCVGCSSQTNNIAGYEFMGELNDSKYFRSVNTSLTWAQAQAQALSNGGHLAVVSDAAENDFIRNNLTVESGWLGYTDEVTEGTFVWVNSAENSTYTNWRGGEPNNSGNEDYTRILRSTGEWTDRNATFTAQAVLEIPCGGGSGTGDGNLVVKQIRGVPNGGEFQSGVNEVAYQVTDDCGNEEICTFEVTVNTVPADLVIVECPVDLTIDTDPGASQVVVDWTPPTATSDCFRGQIANVDQTLGTDRGDLFDIGTQTIAYAVFDSCGNFTSCAFNVTVNATPALLNLLSCPGDISVNSTTGNGAQVSWDVPTATTDCYLGNLQVTQIQGLAPGSNFPEGTTTVAYIISDACNNTEICLFNVNVGACPAAGTACDDGDPSTENDVEDGACNCAGTPCPTAGTACDDGDASTFNDTEDGLCNCVGTPCPTAGTTCDDGDPSTENDVEDGFCNCAGTPCPTAGTTCDDGDPSTINDVEDGNCNCAGTACPTAGTACDDGDPSTENDVEDGNCNCAGTPCPTAGTACDDGNPNTINDVEDGNCNCIGTGCPAAGTACDDGDPSTENDVEDGNCNCAGTPCPTAGTACDDGDPSTENDVEDGNCNCAGTPCPTAGTACDDGDPSTENDVEDGNCNCAGTPTSGPCTTTENLSVYATATQSSTQQNAEADRAIDGNTGGEFYVDFSISQTNWEVQPWLELDLGGVQNIESIRIWNRDDCCTAFLSNYHILVSDVAFTSNSLSAIQGQAGVDDYFEADEAARPTTTTINRTGRYVRLQLEGTSFLSISEIEVIGCLGTPLPPTCDDGIQNGNETGVDCGGPDCPACCPAAGTACDDGDANTENDVEDGNCNCAGTPINNGPCATTTNLAIGKTATQSSAQNGATADKAIDGNTNGNFYEDFSITQTNWENQPWWEIDLGTSFNIDEVAIWNREDCCTDLLSNYYILVSDAPFASTNLNDVLNQTGVTALFEADQAARSTDVAVGRTGRYIRVQLQGQAFLSITEVEVNGCGIDGGTPTCNDGIQNGDETGVDCGGTDCPACCPAAGTACDDGDANTENDVEDGNCNCAGTLIGGGGDLPDGYCGASATQPWQAWISNVTFGLIDNSSSKDGYGDFTDQATSVVAGGSYPITVTPDFSFSHYTEYYRVWIDFNRDGDLEDAGEMVLEVQNDPGSPAYNPTPVVAATGMIDIPADAQTGATLMRIAMSENAFADPCGTYDAGEVEDYKVVIGGGGVGFSASQIEILKLDARKQASATELDWVTNTEYKNAYFTIERSADGRNFTGIGQVESKGNGLNAIQYNFRDQFPLEGANFYRVMKYHTDGSLRSTSIQKVIFESDPSNFNVYPNPTQDQLNVNLKSYLGKKVDIQIYNTLGQLQLERHIESLQEGTERFATDALIDGVYTITVKIEGRKRISRLFVVSKL